MNQLATYRKDIARLCQRHSVSKLYAFGSILTDSFGQNSDVDLVVDFSDITVDDYADNYFDLKFSLQDILGRKVDLLEENAIQNPYLRQSINQQRQLIYEQ